MEKIVSKGLKIDLHIHSVYSKKKDGDKVKNNTIENLSVLINKLNENGIEMCAITDHDTFNYEIYENLKEQEGVGSIKKVLPGIEFSVKFDENKVIHIVTIFNDRDIDKVKKIQMVFDSGKGKDLYKNGAFTLNDFYLILKEIDLDFVLIGHQKKSLKSLQSPNKTDVRFLGEERFNELVMLDYFDAFEFRDKNNEIYNKLYIREKQFEDKLRFITGTDCHDWNIYPNVDSNKISDMKFTYLKSLPTFKGLAMAVTDVSRINYTDSFFGQGRYEEKIVFEIEGVNVDIPLSRGINVIIGDNSVGKSLLLHKLTENRMLNTSIGSKLQKGYDRYLKKNGIEINTVIPESNIFRFNYQGNVREIFDNPDFKADAYLKEFTPNDIDNEKYQRPVLRELERLYDCIQRKFIYDKRINNLQIFNILENEPSEKELTFEETVEKNDLKQLKELIKAFTDTIEMIRNNILNNPVLSSQDKDSLSMETEFLDTMSRRYVEMINVKEKENEKINVFVSCIKRFYEEYRSKQTDESNRYQAYVSNFNETINDIVDLVKINNQIQPFKFDIAEVKVVPEQNHVDKYVFVSKIDVEKINNEYMDNLLSSVLKAGHKLDILSLTEESLRESITRYPNDVDNPLEGLKRKLAAKVELDFRPVQTITENGKDVFDKLSQGFDARMYFRLLAGEEHNKGIYMVDQPEDHISPLAIKNEVIDQFRSMSKKRQIIMVTHNPQFIINLDVDNVIFLSKKNNHFFVQSGALEYEEEGYSVLDIVASNVDGGLETIRRRMKRYDKKV